MNNEADNKEISTTNEAQVKSSNKGRSFITSGLLILLCLIALGLSGTVYFQFDKIRKSPDEVKPVITQLDTKLGGLVKALSSSEQENQKLRQELEAVKQQQLALDSTLRSLNLEEGTDNNDWQLAEVEHLIIVAIHRLQLEADVSMAMAALQAADDRLRENADPRLLLVRQQLAKDMNTLKAVNKVDIAGLVLYLSDLVGRVIDLPLQKAKVGDASQPDTVDVKDSKWKQLKSAVWQELKDLVIISRRGEETLATLMPEQQYFLYQNLRLQLESARYAVLRRDTDNLQVSIDIITEWLNRYFDSSDSGVANILDSLTQMKSLDLNPALPDISSSLEALRSYVINGDESSGLDQEAGEPARELHSPEAEQ
jgi:uroporphyrin-III C-methyltransferase